MKSKSQNHFMPKLKFKSFISNWEKVLLGELSTKVNQKNNDFFYDQVLTNSATKGIVLQSDYFERAIVSKGNIDGYYIVKKDDFVYNPRISKNAPVGPISRNKLIDGVMSPLYTVFRVKNMNLDFIDHYFKSNHWHKYMKSVANYGARHDRMAISKKDFFKLPIPTPSIEEQNKIAEFLSSVDKKIELLEKKKDQLEQYKKGVMQKIFSQEIRFKDDNGNSFQDWEEKKLGDICFKTSSNLSASDCETDSGEYPVYGASGIYTFIDSFDFKEDYVAIVKDGSGVGNLIYCVSNSSVIGTMDVLRPRLNNDLKFLYYFLQTVRFKKFKVGSSIPHIYFRDYRSLKKLTPNNNEQKKIADFLSAIDNKIDTTSIQIDKTKEFKKGLLQQMFV